MLKREVERPLSLLMENYGQLVNYSSKLIGWDEAKDLLHEAWVRYYDRTGRNLLDQTVPYIKQNIKWLFLDKVKKQPIFFSMDENLISRSIDPQQILESKEFYTRVYGLANRKKWTQNGYTGGTLIEIIKMLDEGYSTSEIASKLNVNSSYISGRKKKLKSLIKRMDYIRSPFNGNKLSIKPPKITRNEFEKHPEKYKDFTFDTDSWSDSNEYYTQMTHQSKEYGLLIVENKRLDL